MKTIRTLTTLALTATFAAADAGKELRLDACPQAVRETIIAHAREGRVEEVDLIEIEDKQIYIAEVDLARDIDLKIFVDGKGVLLKTREDVAGGDTPGFIAGIVAKTGGALDDVEKETAGDKVTYHVGIDRTGAPDLDVVVSANGEVISQTEEADD